MTKQMEHDGMQWNCEEVHTVAQKTVYMFACFALNHPNSDNC